MPYKKMGIPLDTNYLVRLEMCAKFWWMCFFLNAFLKIMFCSHPLGVSGWTFNVPVCSESEFMVSVGRRFRLAALTSIRSYALKFMEV